MCPSAANGSYIGFLAPSEGVLNIWGGPADDPAKATPVTRERNRGIVDDAWTYLDNHLIYWQDTDGDENWKLHIVDVTSGEKRAF